MTRPMPLLDLTFLLLDRPETPSNVGVLMLFDPPAGRRASVAAAEIARAYRAAKPSILPGDLAGIPSPPRFPARSLGKKR